MRSARRYRRAKLRAVPISERVTPLVSSHLWEKQTVLFDPWFSNVNFNPKMFERLETVLRKSECTAFHRPYARPPEFAPLFLSKTDEKTQPSQKHDGHSHVLVDILSHF
jgi:hypothetical protein